MPRVKKPGALGDLVSVANVKNNIAVVSFCRVITSVLAGIVAGILGITGLAGVLIYLVFHAL
ncbi:unnamed protein product, partial [Ostreobium quekettii]|eukprot:evm.model.scf_1412.2 EVM.evm.TU.scf_1412.2   scf_1412:23367-23956(-)